MQFGAQLLRYPVVGHIADELVIEAEDRGAGPRGPDEVLADEGLQLGGDRFAGTVGDERCHGLLGELVALDRRGLDDSALARAAGGSNRAARSAWIVGGTAIAVSSSGARPSPVART